jgi:response regulator RpfG family c-di-GMP phosphodiesterase
MLTDVFDITRFGRSPHAAVAAMLANRGTTTKKVLIVGGLDALGPLEPALEAGHYDVVLVETIERAYSHVLATPPDLIVVCLHFGSRMAFDVLSMLQLGPGSRDIPLLVHATVDESDDEDRTASDDAPMRVSVASRMN